MRVFLLGKKGLAVILAVYLFCIVMVGALGAFTISEVISHEERLIPIYSVKTDSNEVSLGINCAWDNEDVPLILAALDDANVKATFFLVGEWAEKYPESVQMIFSQGHEIGTHSHTHPDMSTLSKEDIITELNLSAQAVKNITGVMPILFRPPSGAYNNTLIQTATEQRYYTIQWNKDSLDWQDKTVDEIVQRCTNELESGDIMLLHAGAKNTAAALPILLKKIANEEYTAVKISELIYFDNYYIDHEGKQHLENS